MLARVLGEKWALPVSGIILSICIFLITWLLLPRIGRLSAKTCIIIGLSWTFLTIFFEFASGLAGGITVRELVAAYNPVTGNLWLLVLATTMLSPMAVRKITRDKQ